MIIRSKLFDIVLVFWTLLLGLCIPILAIINRPACVRWTSRLWSRGIVLGLQLIVGLKYQEIGRSNLPTGQVIIACNHQSAWETLVFNILIKDVCIVLKETLYQIPIFGWYLRNSPMISVNRTDGFRAIQLLLKESVKAKEAGRSVLIFPEGKRQLLNDDVSFNRGIALLYRKLELPVVPVAINSGAFWAKNGFMKRSGIITVSYLPSIQPGLTTEKFLEQLEKEIKKEKERLTRYSYTGEIPQAMQT
ncbi:MAG: 1-acyl-sn-glycerol-3-phosphate acyltransferase [Hyphomicrobiaceae bacterium]|nr:1-acyl-sn-glycerol-3-phosphate acyltransferase [Hyphomicrobiaceae bacterium]